MKCRNSSFVILTLLVLLALTACGDDKSDVETKRQLGILKQMVGDTPVYPGFAPLRGSEHLKDNRASVVRCYTARVNEVDVKRFYTQQFESQGWTLAKEERSGGLFYDDRNYVLTFRKGMYALSLSYSHYEDPSGQCNYTLIYYWNPPTPLINL